VLDAIERTRPTLAADADEWAALLQSKRDGNSFWPTERRYVGAAPMSLGFKPLLVQPVVFETEPVPPAC
jgi:hypothetical protein